MNSSTKAHVTTILFAALLLSSACQRTDEPAEQEEIIRPVRVEAVDLVSGRASRTFSGSVKAGQETKLSFKVGGTVRGLQLKVGDRLLKNQVAASLDAQDQSLQVQSAQANVVQVEAQLRNAQAQHERVRALYADNNATQAELDAARTARDSAKATLAATQKQLELAQAQAGKTVLRSPLEGVVARVDVESGENVNPGQTVLVLNSGSRAEVEVAVPETLIGQVQMGQAASVRVAALGNATFPATVTEVGITTGKTATTYPVIVTLDEENERVRSGMAAQVALQLGASDQADRLYVNPKAVLEDGGGRHVFVAEPAEPGFATVKRRDVVVDGINGGGLRITDGLKPGELVVTAGLSFMTDGKRVRLEKAPPEPAGEAASLDATPALELPSTTPPGPEHGATAEPKNGN